MEMLRTFLFEIAGCTSNFTVQNRQQTCISEIREKVGKSKVLVRANLFIYLNYLFSAHYKASLRDNLKKKKKRKKGPAAEREVWQPCREVEAIKLSN